MFRSKLGVLGCCLMLAAGCREDRKLFEEADRAHAAGKLDDALTALELVRQRFGGTNEAEQAQKLGTDWLIQAADQAATPQDRRARLEQALKWTPTSGPAQARICEVMTDAKNFDDARHCLDVDLKDKLAIPDDIVGRTRERLTAHEEEVAQTERRKLLESNNPKHWQTLVERYPNSEEARQVAKKLAKQKSLCGDAETFERPVLAEMERQRKLADEVKGWDRKSEVEVRIRRYDDVRRDTLGWARDMADLRSSLEGHATRPGEEKLARTLRDSIQSLADSAATLADDLERNPLENLDAYDSSAFAAARRWATALGKTAARIEKQLSAAKGDCNQSL